MFTGVLIIGLFIGFSVSAKVQAVRVSDVGWEVGVVGKKVDVYKFQDGKNHCYVAQFVTPNGQGVDITCVK